MTTATTEMAPDAGATAMPGAETETLLKGTIMKDVTSVPLTADIRVGDLITRAVQLRVHPTHLLAAVTGDSSVVDARFAGGSIEVYHGEVIDQPVVQVVIPGCDLVLFPDEARNLASALIAFAQEVAK